MASPPSAPPAATRTHRCAPVARESLRANQTDMTRPQRRRRAAAPPPPARDRALFVDRTAASRARLVRPAAPRRYAAPSKARGTASAPARKPIRGQEPRSSQWSMPCSRRCPALPMNAAAGAHPAERAVAVADEVDARALLRTFDRDHTVGGVEHVRHFGSRRWHWRAGVRKPALLNRLRGEPAVVEGHDHIGKRPRIPALIRL